MEFWTDAAIELFILLLVVVAKEDDVVEVVVVVEVEFGVEIEVDDGVLLVIFELEKDVDGILLCCASALRMCIRPILLL